MLFIHSCEVTSMWYDALIMSASRGIVQLLFSSKCFGDLALSYENNYFSFFFVDLFTGLGNLGHAESHLKVLS